LVARRGTDLKNAGGAGTAGASASGESDNRTRLLQSYNPRPTGRQLGKPLPETDRTRELDNEGVLQLQKDTMREQDEDLDALAQILRRQNTLARAMLQHIEEDNELLDEANARADSLQRKLGVGNRRVKNL
jgi:regulator of vacuolar morphogenesis